MSLTMTRAPSLASPIATALPMPPPAPVTIATFPSRMPMFYPCIVSPPETLIVWPVMKAASSLRRKAIIPG